jgi:hypothetical protein
MSGYEKRKAMPYGKWICADGLEVLFGRTYVPLLQRFSDGTVSEAIPGERVPFVKQEWFYSDATPEKGKIRAALDALADFKSEAA